MMMGRMNPGLNIHPYCFSVFLLLFAIQPVTEANDVMFYTLSAVMGLSILIILISGNYFDIKRQKRFYQVCLGS